MSSPPSAAPAARAALRLLAATAVLLAPSPADATVTVEVGVERSRAEALSEALGAEMVRALEGCASGALVVRVRADLPEAAPHPHALVHAIVGPSVAVLAADAERWPRAHQAIFEGEGADAASRAGRLGYDVLVDLSLRTAGNFLGIEGSVWTTDAPERRAGLSLRSRLDAELRHYVGPLPRPSPETIVARTAALPGRGYLALCAHDLDADGRTELVLVSSRGISILRLGPARAGVRLVEVASAAFPSDLPLAATTSRRPVATAVAIEGAVIARTSEHAAAVRVELAAERAVLTRAAGPCPDARFPVDAGCAELVRGRDFFDDVLLGRDGSARPAPGRFYTHALRRTRTAAGEVLSFEASITPQGRIALRVGERAVGAVGYGTALAMADLDEDGAPELLVSSPAPAGGGDQLSLLRALPRGALHVLWRSEPIAGSIWIARSGDLDGDGLEELLAVEEPVDPRGAARLWIVR